jgi:hypothetical protein
MVATYLVIRHSLIFTWILLIKKLVIDDFFQGRESKMSKAVFIMTINLMKLSIRIFVIVRVWVLMIGRILLIFLFMLVLFSSSSSALLLSDFLSLSIFTLSIRFLLNLFRLSRVEINFAAVEIGRCLRHCCIT